MKKLIALAAGITLTCSSLSAFAALSKSSGFYIEPNVGLGLMDTHVSVKGKTFNQWFGASFNMGYQFMYQAALEVGAQYFPNQSYNNGEKTKNNVGLDVSLKLIKSIISINPNINGLTFFAKAGYGQVFETLSGSSDNNGKHKANTWFAGVGTSLFVDENVGFTLQAMTSLKAGMIPARYLVTAGVTYIY